MFSAGQQFGIYTLIQRLGRGGFGEVWLAERRTKFVTTQVAVKLPLDEQVNHAAIEQEAQLWARASGHANVLPIIEANEYDGQIVIVSEYAPDGSLEALLKNSGGALPVKQSVELMIGILKGLEFLHSRNIIHRDIKPGNILLQGDTPRMADFGISRVLKTTSHATNAVGTPYYMAPEAFRRTRNAQTDVWSVGVMLYQMLQGELPFSGDNIPELYDAIAKSEPEPLPVFIPVKLHEIVLKALSKDVSGRYKTAREMRDELDEFLMRFSHPVTAQAQGIIVKEVYDPPTIKVVSPLAHNKQPIEIKRQATMPEIRPALSPTLPEVKAEPKRLYFAISAVVFLVIAIIGVVYSLRNGTIFNTTSSNNTNTSLSAPDKATDNLPIPFRKGDKWGFSDTNKKLVIEAKYDYAARFVEELALVWLNGKNGFIDKTGNEIISVKYDSAYAFNEGLARVSLDKKWGFIDKTGKEIVPVKYDVVDSFNDEMVRVKLDKKWGFIDKTGKEIIPVRYDEAYSFSDGLACVRLNKKYGLIDKTGKEIIPIKYDAAGAFKEGLARVKLKNKWGFIDKTGKEIIPFKYEYADSFKEGGARASLNNKWGFIDKTGKAIIPFRYGFTDSFSDGLARVSLNKKWGFIDKTGKEIIPVKYDVVDSFSDGLARVSLNKKWGFIDKTGKEILPVKYDDATSFNEGLARVKLNDKWFYIDKNGTEYYEP